jgi:hypothetical protein
VKHSETGYSASSRTYRPANLWINIKKSKFLVRKMEENVATGSH